MEGGARTGAQRAWGGRCGLVHVVQDFVIDSLRAVCGPFTARRSPGIAAAALVGRTEAVEPRQVLASTLHPPTVVMKGLRHDSVGLLTKVPLEGRVRSIVVVQGEYGG